LSNALDYGFTLCIAMKVSVANVEALNQPLIYDDFDLKLQKLK
jgi:hypothetical protein